MFSKVTRSWSWKSHGNWELKTILRTFSIKNFQFWAEYKSEFYSAVIPNHKF